MAAGGPLRDGPGLGDDGHVACGARLLDLAGLRAEIIAG